MQCYNQYFKILIDSQIDKERDVLEWQMMAILLGPESVVLYGSSPSRQFMSPEPYQDVLNIPWLSADKAVCDKSHRVHIKLQYDTESCLESNQGMCW